VGLLLLLLAVGVELLVCRQTMKTTFTETTACLYIH
jgi:hypothetical protein